MMDERVTEAAKRATDNVTGKDPGKGHFYISLTKSAIRILGCTLLILSGIKIIGIAGMLLLGAEILGIVEEIV